MSDGIFLIDQDGVLSVLDHTDYESEAILQQALSDHPEVLAGSTTTGDGSGRLLLIKREAPIPTTQGGSGTFSLDHLFVDAAAVPVIVEVKRSSDTRIRREVVGQMLDYAANGQSYWSVLELRGHLEARALQRNTTPEALVADLGWEGDLEGFWTAFGENLRAGKVRLVFVADRIPPELRRVIEFLNSQLRTTEVLGVEVRQYRLGDQRALVPNLVGATRQAADTKAWTPGPVWDAERMLGVAATRCTPRDVNVLRRLIEHGDKHGRLSWGKGASPGLNGWYPLGGVERYVWNANTGSGGPSASAYVAVYTKELHDHLPADRFAQVVNDLRAIPALVAQIDKAEAAGWSKGTPTAYLPKLSEADIEQLFAALETATLPSA